MDIQHEGYRYSSGQRKHISRQLHSRWGMGHCGYQLCTQRGHLLLLPERSKSVCIQTYRPSVANHRRLFFLLCPFGRGEARHLSLHCMSTFVNFHCSVLLAFSLHFSSSSASARSLFRQSSHLSCYIPRFHPPPCFSVKQNYGIFSSFIMTVRPSNVTWLA